MSATEDTPCQDDADVAPVTGRARIQPACVLFDPTNVLLFMVLVVMTCGAVLFANHVWEEMGHIFTQPICENPNSYYIQPNGTRKCI